MRIISFILVLFLACCALETSDKSDEQEKYAPGTIVYVYEACKSQFEDSKAAKDFKKSYCARFISGATIGSYIVGLGYMNPIDLNDPCTNDFKKVLKATQDKNKNCSYMLKEIESNENAFLYAWNVLESFILFLDERGQKQEILSKPASFFWPSFFAATEDFCPQFEADKSRPPSSAESFFSEVKAYGFLIEDIAFKDIYDQCKRDVAETGGDRLKFKATLCGAEIEGFISTSFASVKQEYDRNSVSKDCQKVIDRKFMFSDDVPSLYCIKHDYDPIQIAEDFFTYIDRKNKLYESEGKDFSSVKSETGGIVAYQVFEENKAACQIEREEKGE